MSDKAINDNRKLQVNYISEITGSGKTKYLIDMICKSKDYFLVVVPSRGLCDEIDLNFMNRDDINYESEILNIHQKKIENPVKAISRHINKKTHRVIITTQSTFKLGVSSSTKVNKWRLIMDEEMSLYKEHEINVTTLTKRLLDDTIKLHDYDENFYRIGPSNTLLWANLSANIVKDSFLNNHDYKTFVGDVMTDRFTTLVSKKMYDDYQNNELDTNGKKFSKFYCMSIMNMDMFRKFKSVLVISSFFEYTETYAIFKQFNAELNKIDIGNKQTKHTNSEYITIHYFVDRNWSTYLRQSKLKKNKTVEEVIYDKVIGLIGDKDYLYYANVNFRNKFTNGTLATETHGINRYKNYRELVYMPSLNATSAVVNVMSNFGMTRSKIDFARNVLNAYQFISRGAVRDIENKKQVNIYVMDQRTVDFLKKVFPKAEVQFHETSLAKIRRKIPNKDKSFMSRVKKRLENGLPVREATMQKYKSYVKYYYG